VTNQLRTARLSVACLAFVAAGAAAQTVRDRIAGSGLGAGYAQMLDVASTQDLSAARYDVEGDDSPLAIDIWRIPYESRPVALSPESDLHWRVAAGYATLKSELPLSLPPLGEGRIDSTWSAYSLTVGVLARVRLGNGFALVPALDVGVARLDNRAGYSGVAASLQPLLDGLLFNWSTYASIATPSIGLDWRSDGPRRRISVNSRVAWSRISSFDESDAVLRFDESVASYSVRMDYAAPTNTRIFRRPLDWVASAGYAGFLGPNRNVLGFDSVAELGLGMEVPVRENAKNAERLRLGVSWLTGPGVRGWSVSLGVRQ